MSERKLAARAGSRAGYRASRNLTLVASALLAAAALGGCGQKGPLYLPDGGNVVVPSQQPDAPRGPIGASPSPGQAPPVDGAPAGTSTAPPPGDSSPGDRVTPADDASSPGSNGASRKPRP